MTKTLHTESREFDAPYVRVRGRLSRQGEVRWSPCIRTFKEPEQRQHPDGPDSHVVDSATGAARAARRAQAGNGQPGSTRGARLSARLETGKREDIVGGPEGYRIVFQDGKGETLAWAPTRPWFFATDNQWATFVERLPYRPETEKVALLLGNRELGALPVTRKLPEFDLVGPRTAKEIDTAGILHLRWGLDAADKKANKEHPLTFFVRFSNDGEHWLRPGVNLRITEFDLDLRELPGGEKCVAQVLATNGYQTSYVETPPFALPQRPPRVMIGDGEGPILFAQGFSQSGSPITGERISWIVDREARAHGGTFDVRQLGRGLHHVVVSVAEDDRENVSHAFGIYDGSTGLLVRNRVGL